ncbi:MAG: hypothetical protein U0136_13480 [Bdellovibrionota bacterium]
MFGNPSGELAQKVSHMDSASASFQEHSAQLRDRGLVLQRLRRLRQLLPNRSSPLNVTSVYDCADMIAARLAEGPTELSGHNVLRAVLGAMASTVGGQLSQVPTAAAPQGPLGDLGFQIQTAVAGAATTYIDLYINEILTLVLPTHVFSDYAEVAARHTVSGLGWDSLAQLRAHYGRIAAIAKLIRVMMPPEQESTDADAKPGRLGPAPQFQVNGRGLFVAFSMTKFVQPTIRLWTPLGNVLVWKGRFTPLQLNAFVQRFDLVETTPAIPVPMWDSTDKLYALGCDAFRDALPEPSQRTSSAAFAFLAEATYRQVSAMEQYQHHNRFFTPLSSFVSEGSNLWCPAANSSKRVRTLVAQPLMSRGSFHPSPRDSMLPAHPFQQLR